MQYDISSKIVFAVTTYTHNMTLFLPVERAVRHAEPSAGVWRQFVLRHKRDGVGRLYRGQQLPPQHHSPHRLHRVLHPRIGGLHYT